VEADVAKLYPEARRVGRGSKRQPSKEMRGIILEIRSEFNRLLDENSMYTIEQATKRLLSSNHLPAYDAIAIDEPVAKDLIDGKDGYVILDETLRTEHYGVGFKKGETAMADELTKTLKEMYEDGTVEKIAANYEAISMDNWLLK
jgi:hypothetical protein